jgi:splicing factor 3B subunit 3
VGDTVTSLTKIALVAGASEVILYTTLQGAVGVLIPIRKKEDVDFFQNLELQMKEAIPSLISRDHLHYRGFMVPVKGVIDGDLCEMFNLMPYEKREHVASEVDREVAKVSKDVETIRTRVAF